jgi:hypothetical protein
VIDKDMMVLQIHTTPEMEVRDPCVETDPTSRDASQVINIKVEEVSDSEEAVGPVPDAREAFSINVEEVSDAEEEAGPVPEASQAFSIKVEKVSDTEEGPVPITFPKIKAEPEVRCMCSVCPL